MCNSERSASRPLKRQLTCDDDNQIPGTGRLQVLHISIVHHYAALDIRISATMHPILQISIAFEYSWNAFRQLGASFTKQAAYKA
jgi:hypothetical protein